jgi:hypothetical protein
LVGGRNQFLGLLKSLSTKAFIERYMLRIYTGLLFVAVGSLLYQLLQTTYALHCSEIE